MTSEQYGTEYTKGFERTRRFLQSLGAGEAEEIAQAAWVHGWERRSDLHDDTRVLGWVNVIAYNIMVSGLRRKQPLQLSAVGELPAPETVILERIETELALGACAPSDRDLLERYYIGGCSCAELASERRSSSSAIHSALWRARRRVGRRYSATENKRVERPLSRAQCGGAQEFTKED